MTNLELATAFFAGAPEDFVAAIRDPDWVRNAREAIGRLVTEDFEFVTVNEGVGMPSTRQGVEGFFAAYRSYAEMWESYSLKPLRFDEVGDRVVVQAKISGTTLRGGVPLQQDVAAVYTFENGRIRRIEEFSDVTSAYAAARS